MKTTVITISTLVAAIALMPNAQASHAWKGRNGSFTDYAQVIRTEPVIRTVQVSQPQRECWDEEIERPVSSARSNNVGATVFGGLVGAAVGHRLGRGHSSRGLATAAGTVVGAAVGNGLSKKGSAEDSYRVDTVKRCRVSHETYTEERIDGYDVTYRYRGETFTTRMPYDPGKQIRVNVSVAPMGE